MHTGKRYLSKKISPVNNYFPSETSRVFWSQEHPVPTPMSALLSFHDANLQQSKKFCPELLKMKFNLIHYFNFGVFFPSPRKWVLLFLDCPSQEL